MKHAQSKRFLSILLVLLMVALSAPKMLADAASVVASGDCGLNGSTVKWSLDSDGVLTFSGTGDMFSYPRTGTNTAPWKTYSSSIKSVVIKNGVTSISSSAFEGCNLTSVSIPSSLKTIPEYAFNSCSYLTGVVIPEGVTEIASVAFSNCIRMTSVTIPKSVTSIQSFAFSGCSNLKTVTILSTSCEFGTFVFLNDTTKPTLYGYRGSTAETYAKTKSGEVNFVALDGGINNPLNVVSVKANGKDLEGAVLTASGTITITFDRGMTANQEANFAQIGIYNAAGKKVEGVTFTGFTKDDDLNMYTVLSYSGLANGAYTLKLGKDLKANNGLTLGKDVTISFTVKDSGSTTPSNPTTHTHTYGSWIVERQATCQQTGTKYQVCTSCGEKGNVTTIPKTGHSYGSWIVESQATCTQTGSKYQVCSVCGEKGNVTTIPKTAHSYGKTVVERQATCSQTGLQYQVCTVCGEKGVSTTIAKTPHAYGSVIVERAATCSQTGTQYQVCAVCGEKGNVTTIPKTAHSYGSVIVEREATCTQTGKQVQVCTVCGAKSSETTIPKTAHTYGKAVVEQAPTCQQTGKQVQVCAVCGERHETVLPKADHTYGSTVVERAATCKQAGAKVQVCAVCGEQYEIEIPKVAHTYKKVITPATVKKDGSVYNQCTACGKKGKTVTVAKIDSITLSKTAYVFNDAVRTPTVLVKDANGKVLKKDTDYKVKYAAGRKECGKYGVKVVFTGKYSGKKTLAFVIRLGKIVDVKQKDEQGISVTWGKVVGATRYEVRLYRKENGKYHLEQTVNVKNNRLVNANIPKGEVWKLKIRAVREVKDGNPEYSAYTAFVARGK